MSAMNNGHDPMLSSFNNDEWIKFLSRATDSPSPLPSPVMLPCSSNPFTLSVEGLLSPEQNTSFNDFWPNDRKRAASIKEEEDSFSSPCPVSGDGDSEDIEMEDIDIGGGATVDIKEEIHDPEYEELVRGTSPESRFGGSEKLRMSEAEARHFVEEQFEKIAFVPSSNLSQREKISYILSKSDCREYTVDNVVNFDKRSADSARACAKIVQNIPQRYRWECVSPEDIPCCYTIVADCKKVSCRDKPPRPMNAFMIWAQGARRLINELCPKMQNAIISEALGFYWRQKSEAFKKKFEDEKVKLRRFHNVEFPEYKYKPKTKVQKAKEKQELSLTKAKMRASVKREKLKQSEDANLFKRRPATRVGRPKKLQMSTVTSNVTSAVTSNITTSETPKSNSEPSTTATTAEPETSHPAMSPSKPAIKNMLSLKLLNDRLSKGSMYPTSRGEVQTAFGQLSPLEVDSPGMNDMFEELSHHDARESARDADTSDLHKNTSSVYDTPANTPPLDDNHDTHHSPAQTQLSPASPPHVIASSASVAPPTSCSSAPTPSPRHITMPSLSAILSTPSKNIQNAQNLIALTTANANLLADSRSQATNELTDFVLTYMSATSVHKSNVALAIDRNNNRATIDANNNESDFNNNNTSSGSHGGTILVRNLGLPPSYTASVRNFRLSSAFNEPSDLDSLSLDLNTPLLSEDEMTSLLFSLRGQYTS